jgi:hypothetical protein
MRGGAQSQLMLGSDGKLWVVKFQNNPQHRRVLANELIATRLAAAAGLTVPASDVVEVTEWLVANTLDMTLELPRGIRERYAPGLQFGSQFVGGLMPGQVVDYLPEQQLWGLMRKRIAASLYTRPGDPMKIDCGYRAGPQNDAGVIRMFQAVSLEGDVEAAKGLAYTAPQLRDGVRRVENAELELTAVVEPLRTVSEVEDEAMERYRFCVEAMEQEAIRVVTLSDLARVAETARIELRV